MRRLLKPVLALAVLGVGIAAWQSGLLDQVSPNELSERLLSWGIWGGVAVLAGWTLLQPFGVSGWIWVMAAAFTWSPPSAMAITLGGSLLSAVVCFGFARYVARDWVAKRVPKRFMRYEERLRRNGVLTTAGIRVFMFSSPPLSLAMGVSSVRFRDYVLGTTLGNVPQVIVGVLLGERILEWFVS